MKASDLKAPGNSLEVGKKRDEILAMVGKMYKIATEENLFVPTDSYPLNGYVSKLLKLHKELEEIYKRY